MSAVDNKLDWRVWRPGLEPRIGLSGKLLLLTISLVLIAEIFIYVPSITNFRLNRLNDRLAAANTAALVLDAAPSGMVPETLTRQILESIDARAVAIKTGQQRRLLASAGPPPTIDHDVDLREISPWTAIVDSLVVMFESGNQAIRVIGPAENGAQFIEVVIDEAPLRQSMYRFSSNLLLVSLTITSLTTALIFLALHFLFVRPMRRLTANMVEFRKNPEHATGIVVPSPRGDEIGLAEQELSDMQRELVSMLHQKSRLAALGLAVSKINHDLRNLLASSQLLSDQLSSVPDPRVQRFAPKLMRSLERAIAFCQSTLSYGRAQEAAPDRRMLLVEPVVNEVRETAGLATRFGDLGQLDRARARPSTPTPTSCSGCCSIWCAMPRRRSRACRRAIPTCCRSESPAAAKARSPSSRSPTPGRACRRKPRRICSRRSRARCAKAAPASVSPSQPNWCAPMAATSIWSKAPSAPPSGSRFPTARSNSTPTATNARGRKPFSSRMNSPSARPRDVAQVSAMSPNTRHPCSSPNKCQPCLRTPGNHDCLDSR